MDTTYGSSMRELELLLENFQIEKPVENKRQGDQCYLRIILVVFVFCIQCRWDDSNQRP